MRKVVVLTGATDGLGRALAKLLSRDYDLALCGRSEEKMQSLLQQLHPCKVFFRCFDITQDDLRDAFCQDAIAYFGTVDILINNAGANTQKDNVADINLQDLRYMFELNCVSALGMIQKIYPVMRQ